VFESLFQLRGERDRFSLPARATDERTDTEPAKPRRVPPLGAIESKIEIAFRPGGVHFGIDTAIIRLLINDEPFGASLDNRHIVIHLHRAHLDGNRRKIRGDDPHAFSQVVAAHKFWMLARDEKDLTEALTREMLRFGNHFILVERNAKDRIIA